MLARNDLTDYLLDHYGTCDLDQPKRNKCYWGGCAGSSWRGRACPHWRPIWQIVHTPTSKTNHRTAGDHYQADFDRIRKIILDTRSPQGREEPRHE